MQNLTFQELEEVSINSQILRSCNDVPFAMSNLINGNSIIAQATIEKHKKAVDNLEDRKKEAEKIKSEKDRKIALDKVEVDRKGLETATYEIELHQWAESDFTCLDIKGDKEVPQPGGFVLRFSYREAFYNMRKFILK